MANNWNQNTYLLQSAINPFILPVLTHNKTPEALMCANTDGWTWKLINTAGDVVATVGRHTWGTHPHHRLVLSTCSVVIMITSELRTSMRNCNYKAYIIPDDVRYLVSHAWIEVVIQLASIYRWQAWWGYQLTKTVSKWRSTGNIWNLAYWISDSLLYWDISHTHLSYEQV